MCLRLLCIGVLLLTQLPVPAWSWGSGRDGGFSGGGHHSDFHGGVGSSGFRGRQGGHSFPQAQRFRGLFFEGGTQEFVFRERFFFGGPGGLSPLGVPGLVPGMVLAPSPVFRAPFFCVTHGLEFQAKAEFFPHLQHIHHILHTHA
jgi:hypothetical protein